MENKKCLYYVLIFWKKEKENIGILSPFAVVAEDHQKAGVKILNNSPEIPLKDIENIMCLTLEQLDGNIELLKETREAGIELAKKKNVRVTEPHIERLN